MKKEEILTAGSSVQVFVDDIIKQAKNGLKEQGFITCPQESSHLKIELNATEAKEAGGGIKAHIVSLGGSKTDSNTQKVIIYAKEKDETETARKKADIAKSKAEEAIAKKQEAIASRFR